MHMSLSARESRGNLALGASEAKRFLSVWERNRLGRHCTALHCHWLGYIGTLIRAYDSKGE